MKENYVIDSAKLKKALFVLAAIALGVFISYKALLYLTPFIIALMLASMMEPLVRLLVNRAKLPRSVASAVSLVLGLALLGYVISLLISRLIIEIKGMLNILPAFVTDMYENITELGSNSSAFFISLPEELASYVGEIAATLLNYVSTMLSPIAKGVVTTAISVPTALIFLIITILATYFISSSRHDIARAIKAQLPDSWYEKAIAIRDNIFVSIFKLLRAYLILMGITFVELLIGLSAIRVKYALVLAFIIAIIDILPVLGTGTVLIPWAVYLLIIGKVHMGIYMFVLYGVILIVRQVIEPKIVGHHIGIHPLGTLMAMYLGLRLLGAAGLIFGPIIMLILKNTFSSIYKGQNLKTILFTKQEP